MKKILHIHLGVIKSDDPKKDFKILQYGMNRNQDLIAKLERGAYSSQRYYINPVSFVQIFLYSIQTIT